MEKLKKDLSKKRYLQPNQGMLEFITSFFPASDVLKRYRPEDRLMGLRPDTSQGTSMTLCFSPIQTLKFSCKK